MHDPSAHDALASELADAFLSSPWRAEALAESGAARLGTWPPWLTTLALAVVAVHRSPPSHHGDLVALIGSFLEEHRAAGPGPPPSPPRHPDHERLDRRWPVARLESLPALADRLELSDGQLAWLADVRSRERTVPDEKLRNYRYRLLPRPDGLPRVVEAPKARLKEIQRWLLHEILDRVPAHGAAHGFTPGRSAVTHARLHTGRDVVLRLDLRNFFASVPAGRIYGIFRTLGYAPTVAHVLTGLCTNTVPPFVWAVVPAAPAPHLVQPRFWLGRQLATPHLPQGAPTSPALSNLTAFRLDRRLHGLAVSSGLRYSRYADDLTFSGAGRLRRRHLRLRELAAEIIREEGFALNEDKTALRVAGGRQTVCGIVVNVRTNVSRGEYDQLRATLHNIARHGPAGQNRAGVADLEAHLRGRISWVAALNPERGARLHRQFAKIDWRRG